MDGKQSRADYASDLDLWQASSCSILAETKPEAIFADEEFPEVYKRLHHDLWERMIRVHGTLHSLEELLDFPFDNIYGPQDMEFWRLVFSNFFDMTCVILSGMLDDHGQDTHTLSKFKNTILKKTWQDLELKEQYQEHIKKVKFDTEIRSVKDRIKEVRNHKIAHRLLDQDSGKPIEKVPGVNLDELWSLFRSVHKLFGAISFGSSFATLAGDLMYATVGGKPTKTCLQTVLEAVLRDSYFVNEPEKLAQWWESMREYKSTEELELLNLSRERVGLPPA